MSEQDVLILLVTYGVPLGVFALGLGVFGNSRIGRALIERLRRHDAAASDELVDEVTRLRHEVAEVQERLDFTERLLTARDAGDDSGGEELNEDTSERKASTPV